ncbi:hypothetical protein [Staphylothermus hellenicus]|uniref:Cobalt transport protein n=1 Tax=Staphylothermus hellenicus (strain DSM 12710 / JCM 10830 / BK20S6-10-b1 / P8) TaxID=591019 RepID=D7DC64_STAHD|nr:hypothetical protein [Staphylothermus hellenicus]ADI31761.1 hypothetical protein Shell_0637 [Staphylothermus hellenicus DSM 12710]
MRIIGILVDLVYKSLFLKGEEGFRATSSLVKILLLALMLTYFIIDHSLYSSLSIILLILILGITGLSFSWFISSFTLSSIPGLWYAITALLFSYTGLSWPISYMDVFIIYLRTTTFSLILLFFGSIISPVRLANILLKLGLRRNSVAPILLWRAMPYGLKSMQESLAIGELKKENVGKRLGPAMASLLEYSDMVNESNHHRLNTSMKHLLPAENSRKHNLILIIACIIVVILLLKTFTS